MDTDRYSSWKGQIRSELEAFEGEGPPSIDQLWSIAQRVAQHCAVALQRSEADCIQVVVQEANRE